MRAPRLGELLQLEWAGPSFEPLDTLRGGEQGEVAVGNASGRRRAIVR
jgi:hypothetical protein